MKPATHYGTCQVCGRRQLLPGGKLSKHGYTKQWGFFNGTCWGADHLPFEQDISLIERAIAMAEDTAQRQRTYAAARAVATDPNDVECHIYLPGRGRFRGGYEWLRGRLEMRPSTYTRPDGTVLMELWFVGEHRGEPVEHEEQHYGIYDNVLATVVAQCNAKEAARVIGYAEQHEQYAAWQYDRIKNWKPMPLEPREPVAVVAAAHPSDGHNTLQD